MTPRRELATLATGGVLAVAATVIVLVGLRGGDPSRLRTAEEQQEEAPARPRVKPSRKAAAPDGARAPAEPRRSESVDVERTRARVVEILGSLAVPAEPAVREPLGIELTQLLRRLGADAVAQETKDRLLELLVTIEPGSRRLVGEALGALEGDGATARRLLAIYRESRVPDVHATIAVFDALGRIRSAEVAPDLLAMLGTGLPHDPLVVRAIGAIGEAATVRALIGRLGSSMQPQTRDAIVEVLGASGDPAVRTAMAEAARAADPAAVASLAAAMGRTGDPAFAPVIGKRIDTEPEGEGRDALLRALGRCADRDAALRLLRWTETGGASAMVAARALRDVRAPDAVDALFGKWEETGPRGRAAMLEAASRAPDPPAAVVERARTALEDPDASVRLIAARTLGRPGARANIRALSDFVAGATDGSELATGLESLLRIADPEAARIVLDGLPRLPEADRADFRLRAGRILEGSRD